MLASAPPATVTPLSGPVSSTQEAWPVHVVHREGRHASHKARAFLDLAIERLRAHPALSA